MKSTYTPAERLRRDRLRKVRERDQLRTRGLRLHQLWISEEDWSELKTWLRQRAAAKSKDYTETDLGRAMANTVGAYENSQQAMLS